MNDDPLDRVFGPITSTYDGETGEWCPPTPDHDMRIVDTAIAVAAGAVIGTVFAGGLLAYSAYRWVRKVVGL